MPQTYLMLSKWRLSTVTYPRGECRIADTEKRECSMGFGKSSQGMQPGGPHERGARPGAWANEGREGKQSMHLLITLRWRKELEVSTTLCLPSFLPSSRTLKMRSQRPFPCILPRNLFPVHRRIQWIKRKHTWYELLKSVWMRTGVFCILHLYSVSSPSSEPAHR